MVGTVKKSIETSCWAWFSRKVRQVRRRFAAAHHIFADTALPDVDAQFEQFAVDARCTPTGILPAHLANQISDFA